MKRKIVGGCFFAVFLAFFPITGVFSISLEELTGPEQAKALLSGEKPVLAQFQDPKPQFVPANSVLQGIIDALRTELAPSVMVETLHIYKKPSEAENLAWSTGEQGGIFNEILALSTLAGLQYYSASRGKIWTFYQTSSVIDGPSTKKPVPDPVYAQLPAELTIYARQKDSTFGDNIYQYDYYTTPAAIIFNQQNLSTLMFGIIPAISKNKLRTTVAILDADDYLLVYAVSMAKAASIPGIKERIGTSFANRAEAVFNWFSKQADTAFQKIHS